MKKLMYNAIVKENKLLVGTKSNCSIASEKYLEHIIFY